MATTAYKFFLVFIWDFAGHLNLYYIWIYKLQQVYYRVVPVILSYGLSWSMEKSSMLYYSHIHKACIALQDSNR
jgi:hypothetical protein